MAKKRTPEQEAQHAAVKAAKAVPEKRWHMNRRSLHYFGDNFGFWSNWNEWSIGWGTPDVKFHGYEVPEDKWTVFIRFWKPMLIVHKHLDLILCWGWDKKGIIQ